MLFAIKKYQKTICILWVKKKHFAYLRNQGMKVGKIASGERSLFDQMMAGLAA